jgi:hypothetical protein
MTWSLRNFLTARKANARAQAWGLGRSRVNPAYPWNGRPYLVCLSEREGVRSEYS